MNDNYETSKNYIDILSCPVCGESIHEPQYQIPYISTKLLELVSIKNPRKIFMQKCPVCSHHFASPIINPELIDQYYSGHNSEIYDVNCPDPIDKSKRQRNKLRSIIEKLHPEGNEILDIGCGTGFLLSYFDGLKWERYGVEPSQYASKVAERKGIKILGRYVDDAIKSGKKFDVVVMTDVIEHLPDPKPLLEDVCKILKPHGYLAIETGNIHSLNARIAKSHWSYFSTHEHVSFYNPLSIKYLLTKYGFHDIRIRHKSAFGNRLANLYKFLKNILIVIAHHTVLLNKKYYLALTFDHFTIIAKK